MTKTKIEWATDVWNPVTGCTKVSAGCKNCYAERLAGRFWGKRKFTDVQIHPERLGQPLHWKKPRRVFVNSMSDLFHPDVPDEFLPQVFAVMAIAKQHTFIILTKRPERMRDVLSDGIFHEAVGESIEDIAARINGCIAHVVDEYFDNDAILPNVWIGVSVENQQTAGERIPLLLQMPAAERIVSCEPLLGSIDLTWLSGDEFEDSLGNKHRHAVSAFPGIGWVIAGGESGPGARPMHPEWVRSLRDHCQAAGVPFFFKQWGEYHPEFLGKDFDATCAVCGCTDNDPCEAGCYWSGTEGEIDDLHDRCSSCVNVKSHRWPDGSFSYRVGKKLAGRLLDGREWNDFPEAT